MIRKIFFDSSYRPLLRRGDKLRKDEILKSKFLSEEKGFSLSC